MKDSKKYFIWLLLIYCLVRLPIILTTPGQLADWIDRGTIAVELIEGLKLPLWDYNDGSYCLSSLFGGIITVPFFILFGQSVFALKLVPFCWHILSLLAWYFVFLKNFSPKQTFLMLLFLCLPPPQIMSLMLVNWSSHFEMILWMALSVLIFKSFLEGKSSVTKSGLLLGLLGGFSSSLIPTNLVTQTAIWLYLALQKNLVQRRKFYQLFIVGFLVGFSPLVLYNWSIDWAGVKLLLFGYFSPEDPAIHILRSSLGLFFKPGSGLQGIFGFPTLPGRVGAIFSAIYVFLYVISLIFLWKQNRSSWKGLTGKFNIEFFGLIFQSLLIPLVVFCTIGIRDYHYLFPILPFVGMMLIRMANENRWLKKGIVTFCIGTGLIGNFSGFQFADLGRTLKMKGFSYNDLGWQLEERFGHDFPRFRDKLRKFVSGRPIAVKKEIYQGLTGSFLKLETEKNIKNILSFINDEEEIFKPLLYEKLGIQLGLYAHFDPQRVAILLRQSGVEERFFPAIYNGVVQGLNWTDLRLPQMIEVGAPICKLAPTTVKPECYKSLGLLDDRVDFGAAKLEHHQWIIAKLEKAYISHYIRGIGENLVWDVKVAKSLFNFLKGSNRGFFLEGLKNGMEKEEDPLIREEMRQNLASLFL